MTTEQRKSGNKSGGKRAARAGGGGNSVPSALRHEMIATAAYFRAEQRGFCGGDSLDDWFAAEAEIDKRLRQASPATN